MNNDSATLALAGLVRIGAEWSGQSGKPGALLGGPTHADRHAELVA